MDNPTPAKVCGKCGVEKPLDDFHRRTGVSTGRVSHCKTCMKAKAAARYAATVTDAKRAANAERARKRRSEMTPEQRTEMRKRNAAYMRRRYAERRDEINEAQAAYRRANPDKFREYRLRNLERNPGAKAEHDRKYRERHAEVIRARKADYHVRNVTKVAERVRAWQAKNPDKLVERRHVRRARINGSVVGPIDLGALWTGLCGICGQSIDRDLTWPDPMSKSVDHIIPLALGGGHVQDNLQWAHLSCNCRKGARTVVA